METKYFFTVIIPVFNKAPHIQRAINSVLNQSFTDFELLIIDDASTDSSLEEIKKNTDKRIRLFQRDVPGPGGYAARNLGIKESRSSWITFLDADDIWEEYFLYNAHKLINLFPYNYFFTFAYSVIDNDLIKSRVYYRHKEPKKLSLVDSFRFYSKIDFIHTNSVVASKKILLETNGFPEDISKRGADSALWLKLLHQNKGVVISPLITSKYYKVFSGIIKDSSTIGITHPIKLTVENILSLPETTNKERKFLKKLSNRKSYTWSYGRKRSKTFKIKELSNFYYSVFSIKDWLKLFRLLFL